LPPIRPPFPPILPPPIPPFSRPPPVHYLPPPCPSPRTPQLHAVAVKLDPSHQPSTHLAKRSTDAHCSGATSPASRQILTRLCRLRSDRFRPPGWLAAPARPFALVIEFRIPHRFRSLGGRDLRGRNFARHERLRRFSLPAAILRHRPPDATDLVLIEMSCASPALGRIRHVLIAAIGVGGGGGKKIWGGGGRGEGGGEGMVNKKRGGIRGLPPLRSTHPDQNPSAVHQIVRRLVNVRSPLDTRHRIVGFPGAAMPTMPVPRQCATLGMVPSKCADSGAG